MGEFLSVERRGKIAILTMIKPESMNAIGTHADCDDIIDTLYAHPDQLGKAADAMSQALNIVMPMLSGNGVVIDKGNQLVPGQDLCLPR